MAVQPKAVTSDDQIDQGHLATQSLPQITPAKAKEQEPGINAGQTFEDQGKIVAEIKTTSEALDKQALETLQKEVRDIKSSHQEVPEIPPDVEDAGVKNREAEAEKVLESGPTLELPIPEETYRSALKTKVSARSDNSSGGWSFVGASSIVALAMWVGRILKMAHKHTMRVIFKHAG